VTPFHPQLIFGTVTTLGVVFGGSCFEFIVFGELKFGPMAVDGIVVDIGTT